jgi:hypothetical protein
MADPFDAVDEKLTGEIDRQGGEEKQEQCEKRG